MVHGHPRHPPWIRLWVVKGSVASLGGLPRRGAKHTSGAKGGVAYDTLDTRVTFDSGLLLIMHASERWTLNYAPYVLVSLESSN